MNSEGGVQTTFRREIEAAPDPDAERQEPEDMLEQHRSPFRTAKAVGIEDVINPRSRLRQTQTSCRGALNLYAFYQVWDQAYFC